MSTKMTIMQREYLMQRLSDMTTRKEEELLTQSGIGVRRRYDLYSWDQFISERRTSFVKKAVNEYLVGYYGLQRLQADLVPTGIDQIIHTHWLRKELPVYANVMQIQEDAREIFDRDVEKEREGFVSLRQRIVSALDKLSAIRNEISDRVMLAPAGAPLAITEFATRIAEIKIEGASDAKS